MYSAFQSRLVLMVTVLIALIKASSLQNVDRILHASPSRVTELWPWT